MTSYYTNNASLISLKRNNGFSNSGGMLNQKDYMPDKSYNLNELIYLNVDKTRSKLISMKSRYKQQCIADDTLKKHYNKSSKEETSPGHPPIQCQNQPFIHSNKCKACSKDNEPKYNHDYKTDSYMNNITFDHYDQLKSDTIHLLNIVHDYKKNSSQIKDKHKACCTYNKKHNFTNKVAFYKEKYEELAHQLITAKESMKHKEMELNQLRELYERSELKSKEEIEKLNAINEELRRSYDNLKEQCDYYIKEMQRLKQLEGHLDNQLIDEFDIEKKHEDNAELIKETIEIMNDKNSNDLIDQQLSKDDNSLKVQQKQIEISNELNSQNDEEDNIHKEEVEVALEDNMIKESQANPNPNPMSLNLEKEEKEFNDNIVINDIPIENQSKEDQ